MELVPLSDAALAQAVVWHRQVSAMIEAADRAGVAADDLLELRGRLTAQAGLLARAASHTGAPLPALVPTPADVAAAGANLGDLSPSAVTTATQTMRNTLAAVDAALSPQTSRTASLSAVPAGPPSPGGAVVPGAMPRAAPAQPAVHLVPAALASVARRNVGLRNAAVYGAYATVVLVVQAVLFALLSETSLPAAAPLCLVVLPAFAWAAGWLSIGALFAPGPAGALERSPRLGAAVCMIPNALLFGAVGVLFVIDTAT